MMAAGAVCNSSVEDGLRWTICLPTDLLLQDMMMNEDLSNDVLNGNFLMKMLPQDQIGPLLGQRSRDRWWLDQKTSCDTML
jgi:hypothetical protein